MDYKPTMPQLTDFPGKTGHFNIAVEIGVNYSAVGTALLNDERGTLLPAIVLEHRGNAEQINMDILSRWVQGKGMTDRTWQGLLNVLRVHCPVLAQDIEETLRGSSTAFSRFSDKLRDKYAKYPRPHFPSHECYKWLSNVSEKYKYIHPDITSKDPEEQPDVSKEAILRQRQHIITNNLSDKPLKLAELFTVDPGEKCKCVLVEGGPGIGKSTLAWQVCHLWGKRALFDQFSMVLLLPLRDTRVQQARAVKDLFIGIKGKEDHVVMRNVGTGIGTLLILDGLDELPGHLLSKRSIFTDLLSGEVLPDATLLVTSRPFATQQLLTLWKQQISKHLVIHGFTENDIDNYIRTLLAGKKLVEFQQHLSLHPHIRSVMYVPLHSAIVVTVHLQYKQLPKTITELYVWFVKIILSQYVTDHSEYGTEGQVHDRTLNLRLPGQVHAYFKELCTFAFKNTDSQELIFSDLPDTLHHLGFTDSVPELFLPGSSTYNFLHLTIQEFLAACHVSYMNHHEQEELLLKSCTIEGKHCKNMMRFVAGITKFEGFNTEILKKSIENSGTHGDEYSIELLYESQNLSSLDKECTYSAHLGWFAEQHHYLAIGYCIANSKCKWKLSFHNMDATKSAMLVHGLNDSKAQPAYSIKRIDLHGVNIDVQSILKAPEPFLKHVKHIFGHWDIATFYSEFITHLCEWVSTCQLETFSFHNLQPDHVKMVSKALAKISSLKKLDMRNSELTDQTMQVFASKLHQMQSLTELDISSCGIDGASACSLADALCNNTTLNELHISENSLGEEGALAMAETFKYNTTLTKLNMSWNSVGEKGVQAVADMLKHNTALRKLDISRNHVLCKGALAMTEVLKYNTTLSRLDMSFNSIGERGAVAMAEMLKENITLRELNMSKNSIGESGTLAMAEMLKHNLTLEGLDLRRISCNRAVALIESLTVNCQLKRLTLFESDINKKLLAHLPAYHANKERVMIHSMHSNESVQALPPSLSLIML